MLAITPRRKGRRIDLRTEREVRFKTRIVNEGQLLNSFYILFRGLKVQTKKKFISGEMLLCCQEQPTKYQFERRYYWKQPRHLNQARNKMDIDITHHGTSFVFNSFTKQKYYEKMCSAWKWQFLVRAGCVWLCLSKTPGSAGQDNDWPRDQGASGNFNTDISQPGTLGHGGQSTGK